jgi:DNA (cytosine-5)-methyltransferase 3A
MIKNVLSCFDGMSCGQIALNRANVKFEKYYASEIKQHAIKVTNANFPGTIQLGDIRKIDGTKLDDIDLIIGGSPCKGISGLNQNQPGLAHDESILFYEFLRLKEETKATYFLLENTHGNKKSIQEISDMLNCNPININSSLVSAQNRPRYYWTNIPPFTHDLTGRIQSLISQPKDKNITTNDVFDYIGELVPENRIKWLESESGKRSVKRSYTRINPFPKAGCLTANGHKKWNENYILIDGEYRFLSQNDLERLQTVPVGYTDCLTYNEAYDVLGDGWTVDVISHILNGLTTHQTY